MASSSDQAVRDVDDTADTTSTNANPIRTPLITESFFLLSPSTLPKLDKLDNNLKSVISLKYPVARLGDQRDSAVVLQPDKTTISRSPTLEFEDVVGTYEVLLTLTDRSILTNEEKLWGKTDDTHVNIAYVQSLEEGFAQTIITVTVPAVPESPDGEILKRCDNGLTTGLRLRYDYRNPLRRMIRVWQAWHILFNNSRVALFKSQSDQFSSSAPLFPFQQRFGAFLTLAQLLGNLFLYEDTALSDFKVSVNTQQDLLLDRQEKLLKMQAKPPETLQKSDQEMDREELEKKQDAEKADFDERLTDLSTILTIIEEQIKILNDFLRILDSQHLPYAYATCNALIAGRKAKILMLKEWKMELRETRKELHSGANFSTSVAMKDILARQGQRVTVFTYITAMFLPLGFFSTYLGMNTDVWSGVTSHEEFWRITGPVTVLLLLVFSYFMFRDDDDIKKDLKPWRWWESKGLRKRGEDQDGRNGKEKQGK